MVELKLLAHAIASCSHQKDLSIDSVTRYLDTYEYLMESNHISWHILYHAGMRISSKNNGWRELPVTINNVTLLPVEFVDRQIELLVENQFDLTPEEFFIHFEDIHPYNDGNGRVGEILFYRRTGTWDVPSMRELQWNYISSP